MDRDEVRNLLVSAITDIQRHSGRRVDDLDDDVCPFSDLEDFDSLNGEEVTTLLLESLSFDDDMNPFISDDDRELTIGEIVDRIAGVAVKKEKVS
jgi:hypothetical protein